MFVTMGAGSTFPRPSMTCQKRILERRVVADGRGGAQQFVAIVAYHVVAMSLYYRFLCQIDRHAGAPSSAWTARTSISYSGCIAKPWRVWVSMRAAIGLFVALAALGGAASAESPGIETAGLYTPLPTVLSETLLWRAGVVKLICYCRGMKKAATVEADLCPDGVKPACKCESGTPTVICPKARN
jgi:hypothetical protein